ncbi:unnamed protein product [Leptidea sinapis]|uniref:Uncharacterized protein n=1 Tax=Leptidea sinapis TaxID=189913 RepID=A0A5E4R5S0_9NEOP|nr:unnamed protein product [Leptidea sinapis]
MESNNIGIVKLVKQFFVKTISLNVYMFLLIV